MDLLLQVVVQLLHLLIQLIVLLLHLLRGQLGVAHELLHLLGRLLCRLDLHLLLLDLALPCLQAQPQLLHLLVHALLLAQLALRLQLALRHPVLQALDVGVELQLVVLRVPQLLLRLHQLPPQRHDLIHLLVALADQVLLLLQQVVQSRLLAHGQARALLH